MSGDKLHIDTRFRKLRNELAGHLKAKKADRNIRRIEEIKRALPVLKRWRNEL